MSEFADLMRDRRAILGLSQRDLARASGVAQPLIAALETGRRQATSDTRRALTHALALRPSTALRARRHEVLEAIERRGGHDPLAIGSVARDEDTSESDLDLVITFPPEASVIDLLSLEEELSILLTVPVDVISANSSALRGAAVRDSVLDEAVPV